MSDYIADPHIYAEALALVCAAYSALDAGDADALAGCFAEDGVWHRPDGAKSGEVAIRGVVTTRPAEQTTAHCVANLRLRAVSGGFVAEYYLTVFGASPTAAAHMVALLDCTDELTRINGLGLRIRLKRTKIRMKFGA